jgi:alkylation response protein AidB-like acyl-CoA dehydrogenase
MPLVLTEEQELLRDAARDFVNDQCTIDGLRRLRDERDDRGFDAKLWKEMAELGWLGIPFPEELGGAGLGQAELGVVLEELGRRLVVSPFLSTVLLGGGALLEGGSEAQKREILPAVCEGDTILALAFQETPRHAPYAVETGARPEGDGFVLDGTKTLVVDGAAADQLIVVARTSGASGERAGLTLFLVDPSSPGVARKRTFLIDSRSAANLELEAVRVGADAVIGSVDQGADVLDPVLDRAAVALSAEMLGGIEEAFARTVAYLKEREQFGAKIGSFQGLKHRAARWFCEVELCRSIVLQALQALDDRSANASELVSTCKARASDTFRLSGEEGIQMHGGVGVTDEEDIGFFMKRARVSELLLGDASFHRNRFAELRAY